MYLGPLCYVYALNCHLVYLALPESGPLCMKKQNGFGFFHMQPQKVKFKFVQVNMKQVSYTVFCNFLKNKQPSDSCFHLKQTFSKLIITQMGD